MWTDKKRHTVSSERRRTKDVLTWAATGRQGRG